MKGWFLMIGLILGNFIYQYAQATPEWGVAIERSYFQAVAIGLFALLAE